MGEEALMCRRVAFKGKGMIHIVRAVILHVLSMVGGCLAVQCRRIPSHSTYYCNLSSAFTYWMKSIRADYCCFSDGNLVGDSVFFSFERSIFNCFLEY